MGPFHPVGEDPTMGFERDLELIQRLDTLGFDEAWIGEHHSAGWETICSPEIFIAVAAERTRHINLGTGVISLPYHHPMMVAERIVLLDHLTRGRVMMGVGPGALVSDAYMLGIDSTTQRGRMDEALGIILRLFTETEPITYVSDWFELHEAMLQVRPFTLPHVPIAVTAVRSPAGVALAGKHGASVLSTGLSRDEPGLADLAGLWTVAEESAAQHGKAVSRDDWRLVVPVHLAENREEAINDARLGAGRFQRECMEDTLGHPAELECPIEEIIDVMVESGSWIVGTPDDCIAGIRRLDERSGGFGGLLVQANDWVPREKMLHSYELMARYVMPQFQGKLTGLSASNQWSKEHSKDLNVLSTQALDGARRAWAERT